MQALLIDDSKAMRRIIRQSLLALGLETIEAVNGKDGVETLRANADKIDIVLVDWNMPEMNGYEFVCAVREDSSFDDLKILMVTTENEVEQMLKALDAGANEYLMKPFTKDALLDKLDLLGIKCGGD